MKRLLNSLAGAASDLSDYAADRVDDWAAGLRDEGIDTPEQPDEFDDDPDGWRDRAALAESTLESTRESRDTAYVALDHIERLATLVNSGHDLADMGSDPNTVTGKMHAAIVRDRKRAAERIAELERQLAAHHERDVFVEEQFDLIRRVTAAVPEADGDDQPIGERVRDAMLAVTGRARDLRNELNGMHERERQVEKVIAAWNIERGNLKGYDGTIDPETPAGRVVELLRQLCHIRPRTTQNILDDRWGALKNITEDLRAHGITVNDADDLGLVVAAVSVALKDRADALQELRSVDRVLDGIKGGTLAPDFMAPLDTLGHRVLATARALIDTTVTMANTEAAARIRTAADSYADAVEENPGSANTAEASGYYAGMRDAARIAADEPAEADPSVAHIDTVNGRQRPAQATETTGERHVDLAVTRDTERPE